MSKQKRAFFDEVFMITDSYSKMYMTVLENRMSGNEFGF